MKNKEFYTCSNCGYISPKELGKCPQCGEWNTFLRKVELKSANKRKFDKDLDIYTLNKLSSIEKERIKLGIEEFDRILGGGIVPGSVILIGGEPGIGKSTLLLQVAYALCKKGYKVFYASGEESPSQISVRAKRLGVNSDNLLITFETELESINELVSRESPDFLIIDSIQTVYSSEIPGSAGSITQVRESTNFLINLSKRRELTTFIVGHVTKGGEIAGPKFLEHLVDVVLYLEGDKLGIVRLLRGEKNRYGETNDVGVFSMCNEGLKEVVDPTELFIYEKELSVPGTIIFPSLQGMRPLFLEVQALCTQSFIPVPRRNVTGFDFGRTIMLVAVLEKRSGIRLGNMDIFVNLTGGVKITEPAADLAVSLSIASSLKDKPMPSGTVAFGEVGLSGEIRPVQNGQKRLKEALKRGFKRIIVDKSSLSEDFADNNSIIPVENIKEAIEVIY
jgi:DNA repair protein RadA/Sms